MRTNLGPGKLIVLEGLDGAGTTTQARMLGDWLRTLPQIPDVCVTWEPSAGPVGTQIRQVLTHRLTMDRRTLTALFAADRLDHLYNPQGVVTQLKAGAWVVMDRYYLSSFAYQALSLSASEMQWLWHLHEPCIVPDVTFFLDVPVDMCVSRIGQNRGANFELFEKSELLTAALEKYHLAMADFQAHGEHVQVIDGTQSKEAVEGCVRSVIISEFI
jgi:dTMP kinase